MTHQCHLLSNLGRLSLLSTAAGLFTVAAAQAADLPSRKASPVTYVRLCDAYGAGFFYIPGTETCLRVGGLALFDTRVFFNTPYSIAAGFFSEESPVALTPGLGPLPFVTPGGGTSLATAYRNPRARDDYGLGATARLELESRTATGYGTLRAFIRIDFVLWFELDLADGCAQPTLQRHRWSVPGQGTDDRQQGVRSVCRPDRGSGTVDVRLLCRCLQLRGPARVERQPGLAGLYIYLWWRFQRVLGDGVRGRRRQPWYPDRQRVQFRHRIRHRRSACWIRHRRWWRRVRCQRGRRAGPGPRGQHAC